MRISISGKNLEISSYMREVAEKKLSKLDRYFPQDTEATATSGPYLMAVKNKKENECFL